MGVSEPPPVPPRRRGRRRAATVALALLLAAVLAYALSRLDFERIGHALITASPGWIVLAVALMASSLVLRSLSWHQTLRAALPDTPIAWAPVTRATMIGVMGSAVFPGRIGEPSRVLVLTRRLGGPRRQLLPIVAGTVFSQTLINLLALAVLAVVTFTAVPLLHGHATGIVVALAIPLAICGARARRAPPALLGRRSRSPRMQVGGSDGRRACSRLARRGLLVFARPRYGAARGHAAAAGLGSAVALLLRRAAGAGARSTRPGWPRAAAILLAVNVSAILPATPSNVGVFQAACLVVLAAYGVGAGRASPTGSSCRRSRCYGARAGRSRAAARGTGLERSARWRARKAQPARARSDWRSERVVCSTAVGS